MAYEYALDTVRSLRRVRLPSICTPRVDVFAHAHFAGTHEQYTLCDACYTSIYLYVCVVRDIVVDRWLRTCLSVCKKLAIIISALV